MTTALIRCDGAEVPPSFLSRSWNIEHVINHRGSGPNLNLRIDNLSHTLLTTLNPLAADLVRIAAYAYAADQSVRRGGPKDVYGREWRREFGLAIPVSDPAFWSDKRVCGSLCETLGYVSDDHWEFSFCASAPSMEQLVFDFAHANLHGEPDSLFLFSGGADSLCAVVEAVADIGLHPILVSHRPAPHVAASQKRLVEVLRARFPNWPFPHLSIWVHRKGGDARETTQRTRSFLFASLAAAIAYQLNLPQILIADNGIVSLNLPISGQLIGATASRSTHPKFLHLFGGLIADTFPFKLRVSNPLWSRTRAECVQVLTRAGVPELLQETNSCAHRRGSSLAKPHCGVCSQCIDRRFGSMIAGVEEHDLPERYEVDVFRDELEEGGPRTLAESYVRSALRMRDTPVDDQFFEDYPQLYECVDPADPNLTETARSITSLLRRHANSVMELIRKQVILNSADLASATLPTHCLVRLVASGRHAEDPRVHVIRWLTEALQRGLPPFFQDQAPESERAVQNAVEGIFSSLQEKLRREVPVLPFAGISTKPDFSEAMSGGSGWLFIEAKYPATRQRRNQIVTEITSRTVIYRKQSATVLFPVYDHNGVITDVAQFKDDCSHVDQVWVEVIR